MVVACSLNGPIATVTIKNPPVNASSRAVRQGLMDALGQTEKDKKIQAVVLRCEGRTFVAGADVREFGKPPTAPFLPDVVTAIENATKPWIAALHGSALGGGLELALACHYRIADGRTKLGLPEVNLGLIPGAGGTVRLPRLVGPEKALQMMTSGKPINAKDALNSGLVDALDDEDLHVAAKRLANKVSDKPLPVVLSARDIPNYDSANLSSQIDKIKARARGQNSPIAICDALGNTLTLTAGEALDMERELFLKLKDDPQSLALRHIFFAERAAGKIEAIRDIQPLGVAKIGVIGGGTMGAGIAAACLLAGLSVTMIERDNAATKAGETRTQEVLSGSLKRGLISSMQYSSMLAEFSVSTEYSDLAKADVVIEAVFEEMSVKHTVFAALDEATKPEALLASNTSYLNITEIAARTKDPSRVIGLHFFSPAHIMKLLELVIPPEASPRVIATGAALGKRLRKITVPSGVCDGFIGNRIMSAYRRTCDYMIEDGALPAQVDAAMRDFGFPIGIFEMQDLAGLDIAWAMRKRRAETRSPKERYVDIADKLCEAGRFGRKTGLGWYKYDGKTAAHDPDVEALILKESARKKISRRSFSEDAIMDEILTVMQSEGQAILSEGIAAKASDIDVVMVNGYGFPRWRGGPMFLKG